MENLNHLVRPKHVHHHEEMSKALDAEATKVFRSIQKATTAKENLVAQRDIDPKIKQKLKEKGFEVHKEKANALPLKEIPKAEMYDVIRW